MIIKERIVERVKECYWVEDINCATTNIKILSEQFVIKLSKQVIDSALGMHGAGGYGAQCGLVEGALMAIGIIGRDFDLPDSEIVNICRSFAKNFEEEFGSLLCKDLRPQGFSDNDPPHLCEKLTGDAVYFNTIELKRLFKI